jgi:hypothetical protein
MKNNQKLKGNKSKSPSVILTTELINNLSDISKNISESNQAFIN